MDLNTAYCASCGQKTEPDDTWTCLECNGEFLVKKQYLLLNNLGAGGTGSTCLAEDLLFNSNLLPLYSQHCINPLGCVAIKEIPWRWKNSIEKKDYFYREINILI